MSISINLRLMISTLLLLAACSPSGGLKPVPDAQGTYSLETRTGIEVIDNVIEAVASGDREQLESLISYTTAPCTTREGFGGPPKCLEGEAEGTLVDGLPMIGSEGGHIRKDEIGNWTGVDASALFAVYRNSEEGVNEPYYPRGEYAVVFLTGEGPSAITLRIAEGGIVRVDYPFTESLEQLKNMVEQDASQVILMPDLR
jgi:hypothetical protein